MESVFNIEKERKKNVPTFFFFYRLSEKLPTETWFWNKLPKVRMEEECETGVREAKWIINYIRER